MTTLNSGAYAIMKKLLNHFFLPLVFFVFCNKSVYAQDQLPEEGAIIVPATEAVADTIEPIPFDEIRTFAEVFAKVKNDYVETVNDRQLIENAIRGLLEGLDPHSAYLDKEAFLSLQEGTSGEFGGLGIEVSMENGFVKVISPIDDTPAQKAGIKAGDLIIRLDDTPVKGLSLNDAVEKMRGKPGTDISITIAREGVENPLTFILTRDLITRKSATVKTLEPGFGYLRISNFQTNTANDAQLVLESLIKDNNGKLKGLILDLRNNPGGLLNGAVAITDLFLEEGLIVYTEGRINDSKLSFDAKPVDILDHAPMIVLVNDGSASASEIVAGALQDHKRAIIVGQKTFGKGSVQTILPMMNDSALKLTTARYFTPSGRSIQASGIQPDILIDQVKIEKLEENALSVSEANLSGHLSNDTTSADPAADNETAKPADVIESLSQTDYALYEALNVLKGLAFIHKNPG